mmetsp:Transcript_10613/g.21818  ORF Transcript_10613/g.21818 Transcript_10613/m.21818 type:complete len:117 (-) Transcript_10613:24-374(-)
MVCMVVRRPLGVMGCRVRVGWVGTAVKLSRTLSCTLSSSVACEEGCCFFCCFFALDSDIDGEGNGDGTGAGGRRGVGGGREGSGGIEESFMARITNSNSSQIRNTPHYPNDCSLDH